MMVRVRMAPSPTGFLHIGTARTALFNFLFAKKMGGTFIARIEDTDTQRSTKEFEHDIINGLHWLGLHWDEGPDVGGEFGPYRDSERLSTHTAALQQLLDAQKAYFCYCTTQELDAEREHAEQAKRVYRYSGRCRTNPPVDRTTAVIRFKLPGDTEMVSWKDHIRDAVTIRLDTLDDFIIARSLESPLYNFTVVVDDALMQITHVIRGEDHISNTPKQILLAQALGYPIPEFAHIPLILNSDRTKMSKRKNKVSMNEYRQAGYLPESIVNFLALLGWNPGTDQELFSLDELSAIFDLSRVQQSGAIFNEEKLRWFNQQYLAKRSPGEFAELAKPFLPTLCSGINQQKAIAVVRPRVMVLSEIQEQLDSFTQELPGEYSTDLLLWPKAVKKSSAEEVTARTRTILQALKLHLSNQEIWEEHSVEQQLKGWMEHQGFGVGDTLWPLRVALSGQKDSPNPFELLEICGKELSLKRIDYAIEKLQ